MKSKNIKNKITLFYKDETEENPQKKKVELYDFSKVDHYYNDLNNTTYLRVLCGNSFYYFVLSWVVISEIEIY